MNQQVYSHKDLVKIATKWAYGRHQVVITEKNGIYEIPDVLAFSYSFSTLIECKTSKADFYRDKKKLSRWSEEHSLGNYRVYCCPKGLLKENDIPEKWVLLEVYPSGYAKLNVGIYKYSSGVGNIWWHELTNFGHKAEKRMLFNKIVYRETKLEAEGKGRTDEN